MLDVEPWVGRQEGRKRRKRGLLFGKLWIKLEEGEVMAIPGIPARHVGDS